MVVATQIEPGAAITRGTAEEEKKMTVQQTSPPWVFECNPNDPSMCANLLPGGSPPAEEDEMPETPEGCEHFSFYHPDQAVIQVRVGLEFDPARFGFEPVEPLDLFLFGEAAGVDLEEALDALAFIGQENDGKTLGIYKLVDPEDDLFTRINQVQDEARLAASPHYLLRPAPKWRYGPHSQVARLDPMWKWDDLQVTGPGGEQVCGRVIVIDTGANGDLSDIGISVAEPEPQPNPPDGLLPHNVGHGTFAASIAKKYNPDLDVELYRASLPDGTFSELAVLEAFRRASPALGDVLSLSFGTYPCGPRYDPLVAPLAIAIARKSAVVAASGNDGSNHVPRQLYPASRPDVIAVGAFDTNWQPAAWANPGEVHAPGEDVVGWYHDNTDGSLAVWSGTSFATPYYAACLASGAC